jgi:lysophospholipase L1-like esterase
VTALAGGRRLRVAVLGNSVPLLMVPERTRRRDGTYPELLTGVLAEAGIDAEVTDRARMFEMIHEGARRFGEDVTPLHPDVLVVHYGIIELQPNVLPTTLVRHLSVTRPAGRGVRRIWRRHAVPRLWPPARAWQRWASARAGLRTWRFSPTRFVAELDHLVRMARYNRVLVLVLDVHDPGPRLEHFLPGIRERWQRHQAALRRYVDDLGDPAVRLVEVSAVAAGLGEGASTDGLHLGADGHALLAQVIAKEIAAHEADGEDGG